MYSWTNEVGGVTLGEFRFVRDTNGREIIVYNNTDTFSFAGNTNASPQLPSIKYSKIGADSCSCHVNFINRPQNCSKREWCVNI